MVVNSTVKTYNADEHMFGSQVSVGGGKLVIGSPQNQLADATRPGQYIFMISMAQLHQ